MDGQIRCVRLDNGHRIWAADLGDRVSMALDAGTFADEMAVAREAGFAVRPVPGIRISHAALLLREASLPDAQE